MLTLCNSDVRCLCVKVHTHVGHTDTHRSTRLTPTETGVEQPSAGVGPVSNGVPALSVESRGRVDKCELLTQLCVVKQFEIQCLFKEGETKPKQSLTAV